MNTSESASGFHFINLYQCCPRKFYMRYVKGWRPKAVGKPLVLGGAFHEGKAAWYLGKSEKASIRKAMEYVELFKDKMEGADEGERTANYEEVLFRVENLLHYWIERIGQTDRLQYKPIAIEEEMTVPIEGTPYVMTMRQDGILHDKANGLNIILETKTSSFSHRVTKEAVYYGDQATCYLWGVKKQKPKLNIYAVMPDIAYWNKTTRDVNNIQFIRGDLVFRNDYQLKLFENSMKQLFTETTQKIQALKQGYDADILFPRNSYYCLSYSKVCEYANVCQQNVQKMRKVPDEMEKDRTRKHLGRLVYDPVVEG